MASEKLITFILKAKQNKRSDEQITQQLLSVGWKQEAVTDAFSEIKSHKMAAPPAAQAAKAAQAQQPAQTAPPWVKPAASAQPASPAMQPSAQATSAPVSSAPQQPSSAPVAQPAPAPSTAPPQQAPAVAQAPPVIPTPQPTPQSPIPPASPIQLPAQKKSLFSSLFGKKPSPPPAPAAQAETPQPQAPAPQPAPAPQAAPAARPPIFPPRTPSAQPPASAQPPTIQGQSTLPIFAGTPAQQSAAGTAPPLAQQTQPPATPPAPPAAPSQPPANQAKPAAGIMKFLPIIVFVVILAAAGAYYVFVMAPAGNAPPTPSQPIAPPAQNITPSATIQQAAGPSDCGTDMGCFIQASASCRPAKVVRNSSTDFFGMLLLGSTYMEIQNTSETGKCSLYSQTLDSSVKLGDAMVATALAKGVSIDDIKRQEAESTRQAKAVIGLNGTCKYSPGALAAMLGRWNAGSFSSSDYAGAGCTGTLYSSMQPDGSFSANLTIPNLTSAANASAKPNATIPAPANTTKANTTTTVANNTTPSNPANSSVPVIQPKNTTAANATSPANNSTSATFRYTRKYTTYYPEHLVWFCTDRDGEFYRMHWVEFFGGDCNVPKPKEGFVGFDNYTATGCTMVPCCVNGPYNEYSRSYDYFECGFNY